MDKGLGEGELLISTETIDELNQVLAREEFAKYVSPRDFLDDVWKGMDNNIS